MATDPAERQRRSRAHRRGDHALCDPTRCDQAEDVTVTAAEPVTTPVAPAPGRASVSVSAAPKQRAEPVTPPVTGHAASGEPEPAMGGIETSIRAFVAALPYDDNDPRAIMGQLAVLVAASIDDDGAATPRVRELRTLLAQLAEAPGGPAGPVDEQRLRKAQRKLDGILAGMA